MVFISINLVHKLELELLLMHNNSSTTTNNNANEHSVNMFMTTENCCAAHLNRGMVAVAGCNDKNVCPSVQCLSIFAVTIH